MISTEILHKVDLIIGNTILFTGREYDKEIKLYYYRARYYDPEIGRFISRDPIGQVDDVNLYGYMRNNPVMFVDPSGEAKAIIIIGQQKVSGEFDAGAFYQYDQYLKQDFKPKNIITRNANSIEEFNDIVHGYNNIISITFLSHGSPKTLGASRSQPMIGENNILKLRPITNENGNMYVNTTVNLIACNAGAGENSIGQQMANELGILVVAPDGYVDIGTSEGLGRAMSYPGMFNPNRKSGEPTFYNSYNTSIEFWKFHGQFNTFNPEK